MEALSKLQLDEPRVVEKKEITQVTSNLHQEGVKNFTLPERLEDLKQYFKEIAKTIDYESLLPMEITNFRSKAKELLNQEEDSSLAWVDIIKKYSDDAIFFPFLAELAIKKLVKVEERRKESQTVNLIFDLEDLAEEQLEFIENQVILCNSCKLPMEKCNAQKKEIIELLKQGNKVINQCWHDKPLLRPCIASVIIEQIENGLL